MITRFAPSPTGLLHVGGLRTALYAYLTAKKEGGTFVLRIEDTDQTRLVDEATQNIIEALNWASIGIDEGVMLTESGEIVQKGENGPYIQSERKEAGIYATYAKELIEKGWAYYAFDTAEELESMRTAQQEAKLPPSYDRERMTNQLTLGDAETQKRIDVGMPHVVRLKMPKEGETSWKDVVRGEVSFKNELIDDQVLLKSDGFPTYHFAVVVDDHLMGVTHVIRGEEWISSTPKHIVLYKAFGWKIPTFAHLSLLVNEQKQKLSKRHGDVSVQDFKEKGYLPEALINFIAFLGWNPGDDREIFSLAELEAAFDLGKVGKAAAVFNYEKLRWYNKQYIAVLPSDDLAERARPFYQHAGVHIDGVDLSKIVALEQGRSETLQEIVEHTGFLFADQLSYDAELLVWRKSTAADAKSKLTEMIAFLQDKTEWTRASLEPAALGWIKEHEYGNGDVLWPMRVALSGQKNSPGPFEIAEVLGRDRTIARMEAAVQLLD